LVRHFVFGVTFFLFLLTVNCSKKVVFYQAGWQGISLQEQDLMLNAFAFGKSSEG